MTDAAAATTIYEAPRLAPRPGETVVTSTCGHNCGGRCVVNAHVRDGRIVHISTDQRRWNPDHPPLPACARGVGQIERTYHPERLQHPMRRTGPRGSGQFERISWDQAFDTVAREMLRIRANYGNAAILDASRSGSLSMLHGRAAAQRFLNMFGGCTVLWSNMSAEAEVFSVRMTYGPSTVYKAAGRELSDFANSKYLLMWGWSPGDGTFGTGTMAFLKHAKKQGARIVCVDPRRTMTSRQLADEHIFIRPSTDTAALLAMAQVIVSEDLHDQAYCDRYVLGFDDARLRQCAGDRPGRTVWRYDLQYQPSPGGAARVSYSPVADARATRRRPARKLGLSMRAARCVCSCGAGPLRCRSAAYSKATDVRPGSP